MYSRRPSHIKMEGLRNDLLLTAYGQPENNEANTSSTLGPRAQKVFFDREDTSFLPTPPDSPVLAELTTAGLDIKPDITKLNNSIQEGAQAVPNLEINQPFTDTYLNTVYSPFQTTSPFYEGTFSDDPFGASNNVLVKQEPDVFSDVYNMCDAHQFVGWGSQTMSVFEAAPQVKEEYSEIPSPAPSSPFDTTSSMGSYGYQTDMSLLPEFSTGFPVMRSREQLNSGGEDTEFDSGSEASFSLTTADSEDSLDDISPFDPNNPLHLCDPSARPRTHNYRRNTIDHSVATLKRGDMIPPVSMQSVKKARGRGRPRKFHGPPDGDGRSVNGQTRRGRGRREAMKGNHLWEFIRDLLKDSSYCPKFIRWEEKDDGVFRFVNSEAVASMWGRKKNNPAMTYEKLSRAMRYYYKRDILERVDGRRLVYKFGKNAVGWKQAAGLSDKIDE